MHFEWDENKRLRTLRERGIDFIDMVNIWDDPNRQERFDNRISYGEGRIQTIGKYKFDIFFVVYTERSYEDGEEIIRIISARRATSKERKLYFDRTFPFMEAI
jgi:uncharacterized DUF497 family protein